ncbi:uncharacterized MFS-type transporter C09D4.1-like isoform X2 [Centruroides sculpturatus]|uniref:uncharacterized MFS-type transporter C09D4.1-like isoform X2 n=1 Tax=Centruroides sculpturatus TaxID=218467 RepID=UPI000C6E7339|nr:uncharacterized MFS-type transporter C09D4.1-like isoform X2 [Centruroides sculpturatus]XP_023235906.1 uncharacterized MFS-type transporter C09D4.1-like isoform X2 [Centruroides sculpturatus]
MDKLRINGEIVSDDVIPNGSQKPVLRNSLDETTSSEMSSAIPRIVQDDTQLYPIRHVMLILFCFYSMSNAFQWIEYSIINNIICKYYDVDGESVNWTSVIYMVTYIPLIFPASWLLDKKGLRFVILLGSFGTCVGSWIKCASVSPDRFVVTMVGQTVVAVSQIFILGIPPKLAATWYSSEGVSRACAVGVFGNQFGIALGFLLPPLLVRNADKDTIGKDLTFLFFGVAIFTSLLFLIIIFAFKDKPPKPPSRAQAAILASVERINYWKSILNLIKNINYTLLLITYGINVGVFYAISTLLNQVVLIHFPGEEQTAGWMGLTIVLTGMLGSVVCGYILDLTHKFKETTIAVYILSLVGMISFTLTLHFNSLILVFVLSALLGFFMTGYLPLGFEFAAEITYPEAEGTSSGLLNASAQVFGILCTTIASSILNHNDLYANLFLISALFLGTLITVFIKSELRRQQATQVSFNNVENSRLMDGRA